MQVKDAAIISQIRELHDHYIANIASRFMRPLLLQLPIDRGIWDSIDAFTHSAEHFQYQGFDLGELYWQMIAFARFIDTLRRQLLPSLKNHVQAYTSALVGFDRVQMNIVAEMFPSNLDILAKFVQTLYKSLRTLDETTAARGKSTPLYNEVPDIDSIIPLLHPSSRR